MRGKDGVATEVKKSGRITPAHAGKRETTTTDENSNEDHPRTCGEKFARDFCALTA